MYCHVCCSPFTLREAQVKNKTFILCHNCMLEERNSQPVKLNRIFELCCGSSSAIRTNSAPKVEIYSRDI